jgi:hypothetical protein
MKLVDMKMPKKTKAELKAEDSPSTAALDQPQYPYGMCLSFDKDAIEKLDVLKDINADVEVTIQAKGFIKRVDVTETSKKANGDRSRRNVDVQITDVGIEVAGKNTKAEDLNMEEYKAFRRAK